MENVVAFARAKQPEIICMAHVARLLAAVIGRSVIGFSRGQPAASLKKETLLAGGLFGILLGLLYVADTWGWESLTPRIPGLRSGAAYCAS